MQSGDNKYIDSSINPQENSVSTVFKALKDDLDEQGENDIGTNNAPVLATRLD
jgi:hypothetical protein